MKKLLLLLIAVFIGFGSLTVTAQSVTVANGTGVNSYIPMYGLWMDEAQHNQIIYPESMLTDLVGETVNTVMFFLSSEPSNLWTSTATLKVGTSVSSSFTTATHNQSPVTQIYSGNINISGGVVTFVLDSTFTYNGGNLLLDVTTVGGNYSSASFFGTAQMGASIYAYGSNSGVENFIPKTMFVYGNCLAPTDVTVDSITQTSAMVTWQPGAQETDWDIFVGNGTEDLSTVTWIPLTSTSYEIQGLNPNTVYTVFVRANCGTEYSYEVAASFRTDCGLTLVPYTESFESFTSFTQPSCWQFIHPYPGYSYDYPTINDYQSHTGQHAMYFYTDYYNNPTQVQYAILPMFGEHITNLQLSLYSRRDNEYSGTFYIGYITDSTDESTFVPMVTRTAAAAGDDLYHRDIVDFSNVPVDPDSTAYIAIGYQNNSYYGWYVDDIEVTLIPDCSTPVGLVATDVTTNSATLTWTPGTASSFNVYYKGVNDTAYTEELALSDTSFFIENLNHSSFYQWYVEAVCDDGSLTTSEVVIFGTACAAIDTLPFFVDFETLPAGSNLPYCWTRGNEDSNHPYVYMYESYAGSNSLYFYNTNTIAMPQIDNEELDIHAIQLSFYAKAYTTGSTLQVGVMTNPNVSSSFMPVGSPISLSDNYQFYEVTFSSYTGNGSYIAFRNPNNWESIYLDNVTLDVVPDCTRPESVWAQTLDSTSATVAWSSLEGQSGWEVVIGTPGFSPDTATAITVSNPSYTFDNLAVNTAYSVYVRTDCGGDEFSSWSSVLTFLTLSVTPATIPYACDFEDAAENTLWTFVQNGQTNRWYIDSAAVTTDNSVHSMYISSDSGATNAYDITAFSVSWAYRDIQFSDADEFELSFDWKGYGESSYDYLRVYIGNPTAVTEGDNSQPTGSTQLAQLNQSSTWQHASFSLGTAYTNTTKRLYFMWRNDYTTGTDPAAAVDNISITGIDCAQPYNVNLASVDTASATISFTPASDSQDAWELKYGTTDSTMTYVNLSATSYDIENLQPGTNYYVYVRTLCSSGDTSAWSQAFVFQTECVTINSVPRFWDFEANNIGGTENYPMPACWYRGMSSSTFPYVYDYDYYALSGSRYLYFYNSYSNLAIMPAIDTTVLPVNTLEISFYAKASSLSSSDARLIVGVVSDVYNPNTFVPVDTILLTEDYPADPYVVMLNHYTGNGDRIAFKNYSSATYAYNYIYVDDLTLEEIPSCLPVSDLTMMSSDLTSITLNWTEGFEESSWNVEYKEASDSIWNTAVANAIPFTLDNLTPATVYDIRVQADCGGDLASWRNIQAHTQVCDTADQCAYTILLIDSYGDGWNGGYLTVMQNGIPVAQLSATDHNLSSTQTTDTAYVGLCDGIPTSLLWHDSQYNSEVTITVIDPFGTTLYSVNTPYQGTIYTFDANCLVPTCPAPTNIAVSDVDMNSATVTWTPGGNESNWNVEYKEASATTWTVVPVTTTSYTIHGLTAATLYDVRVQAECDPVNSNPSAYIVTSFGTSVCAAADQCAYTFILGDSFGDGWNGSYLDIMQNGIVMATISALNHNLSSTQTYDTLTVNLCNNLSTSLVWTAGSYTAEASFTLIGPDSVQIYTYSDMSDYTTYTFTTDCGSGPVTPTDPTVATNAATAIGQTNATLHATVTNPDNVTVTAKGFEWKATAGGTYTQIAGTGTGNTFTANLTGLNANTGYTFRAFITYNGTTVYGNEMTFTTLPEDTPVPCEAPTNITVSEVTDQSITVSWDADPNVSSWNIQYRPVDGQLSSATSNTNSYTITGLTPETEYQIQVQANCGDGNLSDWSTLATATTTVGIDSWLAGSVTLFPNPAREVVNVQCTMNNVHVTSMEVYDVYGKRINTVIAVDNQTLIDVSSLADGLYFVRVTTEAGVVTKTFVKR